MMKNTVKIASALAAVAMLCMGNSGCTDADVASRNLSEDADNFKIPRRIAFVNGITDKYLLEITGYCAFKASSETKNVLNVFCKTEAGYKKHSIGISDNVTFVSEQLSPRDVSTSFYHVTFKPSILIPDFELR
jgi:hypothetical protein